MSIECVDSFTVEYWVYKCGAVALWVGVEKDKEETVDRDYCQVQELLGEPKILIIGYIFLYYKILLIY